MSARDPGKVQIAPGVWSCAVPGVVAGQMVRVGVVSRLGLGVGPIATVEVWTGDGEDADTASINLPVRELRALVRVVAQWPGMGDES